MSMAKCTRGLIISTASPVIPLLYMADMSSNLGFFTACPAIGHPESDLCVEKEPFICPIPSQPGVGQFTPSNFIAVAAATTALCCSTLPPDSKALILLRLAIGQPEALKNNFIFIYFCKFIQVKYFSSVLSFNLKVHIFSQIINFILLPQETKKTYEMKGLVIYVKLE